MKNKLLALMLISGLALTGCNKPIEENKNDTQQEVSVEEKEGTQSEIDTKDEESTEELKTSFYIDKYGEVLDNAEGKKVLTWYSEPSCGACMHALKNTKSHKEEYLGDNAVEEINIVAFLGDYSTTAAGYLVSIINQEKEIANDFYEGLFDPDFTNGLEPTEDDLKELYDRVGGKDWEKIREKLEESKKAVEEKTKSFMENEDLIEASPAKDKEGNKYVYTPFIYSDGEVVELKENIDLVEEIKKLLED